MTDKDRRDTVDANSDGDLLQLLQQRERNHDLRLKKSAPATVFTYNPTTQTAIVILGALDVELLDLPVDVPDPPVQLANVPVIFPRAMGGLAYFTLPILPGDTGHVTTMDRALDEWRRQGIPCDPVDARAHSYADAVFVPGLHPDTSPITPPTNLTGAVLEAPLIYLGATAAQPAVLGTAYAAALGTYAAAVIAASTTHTTAAGVWAGLPGAPAVTYAAAAAAYSTAMNVAATALAGALAATLSTKVLVQ